MSLLFMGFVSIVSRTLIDQFSFGFPIHRTWSFLSNTASSSTILIYPEDRGATFLRTSEHAPITRLRNPIEDYQVVNRRLLVGHNYPPTL